MWTMPKKGWKWKNKRTLTPEIRRRAIEHLSMPEPNTGCWLWLGSISTCGYGQTSAMLGGRAAHRCSFKAFKGEIPDRMEVDHRCGNRFCVNPEHLRALSHRDNVMSGKTSPAGWGRYYDRQAVVDKQWWGLKAMVRFRFKQFVA